LQGHRIKLKKERKKRKEKQNNSGSDDERGVSCGALMKVLAEYVGVPVVCALVRTAILNKIIWRTGNQCNCRSSGLVLVRRRASITTRAACTILGSLQPVE